MAIDCEMVGVGSNGSQDLLARVSVVNYFGQVLLDAFVTPSQRVTDWRTQYSGIRPADLLNEFGASLSLLPKPFPSCTARRILIVLMLFSTTVCGSTTTGTRDNQGSSISRT